MLKYNTKYEILTPDDFQDFYGIQKIIKNSYYHIEFDNGSKLDCSLNHKLMTLTYGYQEVNCLDIGAKITTKLGTTQITKIIKINKPIELFDPINVGENKEYYSNELLSHNCHFLGSSNTLINGHKLRLLTHIDPLRKHLDYFDIFEEPIKLTRDEETGEIKEPNHIYALCVDVAEGKELNSSAFTVVDVTNTPYKIVCTYKDNTISTLLYPTIICEAAKIYNDAYVLVETNSIGKQVADIIHLELEYENLLKVTGSDVKKQQQVSDWGAKGAQFGVRMSPAVKRIGCTNLKTLVETDSLIINSHQIVEELSKFIVATNGTYAAEIGEDDDLVMSLVLFSWLTTQKYFKDLVTHNLRKELRTQYLQINDDVDALPLMIVNDGPTFDFEKIGNDLWITNYEGSTWLDPYKGELDKKRPDSTNTREEMIENLKRHGWY